MPEWDKYSISIPGDGLNAVQGTQFERVSHIAHLKEARRVLEDGFLRAGLVNDGSRLDATRTCVNFFSANTWAYGSIYGSVAWHYDWKALIRGRRIYWVEEKTNYRYPIYRFLISELRPNALPDLTPYDPATDLGPLREKGGVWYFNNSDRVSEFLIDGDLDLNDCIEFDFVQHHSKHCRNGQCDEKGKRSVRAMAEAMAFVFGSDTHTLDQILQRSARWRKDKRLSDCVPDGLAELYCRFAGLKEDHFTGNIQDGEFSAALVRGAMALYGSGQPERAKKLVSALKSGEILETAMKRIVEEHFGIDDYEIYER